jgi:hypothetical protein
LAWQVSVDHHDIIELEIAVGGEAYPVAEGSRILSAEDATDYVVAVSSVVAFSIVLGDRSHPPGCLIDSTRTRG